MNKDDLRGGMVATFRDGCKRWYCDEDNRFYNGDTGEKDYGFYEGHSCDGNLLDRDGDDEYDIMELVWRRKVDPIEEMTLDQVCRELGKRVEIIEGEVNE